MSTIIENIRKYLPEYFELPDPETLLRKRRFCHVRQDDMVCSIVRVTEDGQDYFKWVRFDPHKDFIPLVVFNEDMAYSWIVRWQGTPPLWMLLVGTIGKTA